MEYVLAAVLAIFIMVIFAFIVIKNIIKRINKNTKKYFLDKLQDYDYIIQEKEKELEELNKKLEELEEEKQIYDEITKYKGKKDILEEITQLEEEPKQKENKKKREEVVYDIPTPQYREEEFFNTYKKLKKRFSVDSKEILTKFIEENVNKKDDEEYKKLIKIKSYFDEETLYQCLTLNSDEQYDLVEKTIDAKEKALIELKNYDKKSFSILNLLEKIDEKIKKTDPTVYVYVGNDEINYDHLGKNVKTKTYKNMSEGIIIKYHNKMYDYSI